MEHRDVPPGGDKNTGPEIEVLYALFLSIGFVLVSLRFYVRAQIVRKLWWDDFLLLCGLLLSIVAFGLTVARVDSGFGRDSYYLSPKQISFIVKLGLIAVQASVISSTFTKLSISLFLLRIFGTNQTWKRAVYIIMALTVVTNVSSVILVIFICRPLATLWDSNVTGTCWSQDIQYGIYYYQGATSVFTDFLLALLPIYFLKDLQISFRMKLSICALMSLGVFTGICAIKRTALTSEVDSTLFFQNLNIWIGLETNVAIIAAAIPALRPLWAKSARRSLKARRQACQPDNNQCLNPTYFVKDPHLGADSSVSHGEARVTAQGGKNQEDAGSEGTSPSASTNRPGILTTSDVKVNNFLKVEGKRIPEHSSLVSDKERGG